MNPHITTRVNHISCTGEKISHTKVADIGWEGVLCWLLIRATGSEWKGLRGDINKMQTDKGRKMGCVYHSWQGFSVLCCRRWFRFQGSYCRGADCPGKTDLEPLILVHSISRTPTALSCCRWALQRRVLKPNRFGSSLLRVVRLWALKKDLHTASAECRLKMALILLFSCFCVLNLCCFRFMSPAYGSGCNF